MSPKKYVCLVCGYVYDESKESRPFHEIAEGFECPECGVSADNFEMIDDSL